MNPKQLSPNCKSEPSQAVESITTVGKNYNWNKKSNGKNAIF